jgi:hypothetical protein
MEEAGGWGPGRLSKKNKKGERRPRLAERK